MKDVYREHVFSTPRAVDPEKHTMGPDVFRKYIGRSSPNSENILDTKKFNKKQVSIIEEAYRNETSIIIVGAYRGHLEIVSELLDVKINVKTEIHHQKPEKYFNKERSTFYEGVENDGEKIILIFVFPSKEYVDQVAELIKAIFTDIAKKHSKNDFNEIRTVHFPKLEKSVCDWTGFQEAINGIINFGDVAAIGNVELFSSGLEDVGYICSSSEWIVFGLDDMFGYKIYTDNINNVRIVLIGICESFWGSASAYYCKSIFEAGARHVLYGSKAATLISANKVHQIISPISYLNISYDRFQKNIISGGSNHNFSEDTLKIFDIFLGNTAVTVPTVIGEDIFQRKIYENQSPTCMDCENGHIAEMVDSINNEIYNIGYKHSFYKFVPVHFITDYIYREDENDYSASGNLAVHADDPDYKLKRDKAFRKIGRFFGIYALKNGIKSPKTPSFLQINQSHNSEKLDSIMQGVRGFLDFGMGHEAVHMLSSLYDNRNMPISVLIALAMVAQKFGMSELFSYIMDILDDSSLKFNEENSKDYLRLKIIDVKISTQFGQNRIALEKIMKIYKRHSLEEIIDIDQFCALKRREAIAWASRGDVHKFLLAMEKADERGMKNKRAEYHLSCNQLWRFIGENHFNSLERTGDLRSISGKLSDVRREYGLMSSNVWWQTNFDKGSLSALYLEAYYLIQHGNPRQRSKGYHLLFIAWSLKNKIGAGEASEAFGEVAHSIQNTNLRAIFLNFMQEDNANRIEMDTFIHEKCFSEIVTGEKILDIIHAAPQKREVELQRIINEI